MRYDTPSTGVTAQYNGNISQMLYGQYSGSKAFEYTYDNLNRLTNAVSNSGTLDEALTYDKNGNVLNIKRNGQAYSGVLSYTYLNNGNSNKLSSVTGSGFISRSYAYDANGNATSDGINKQISYNLQNLPQTVTQSGNILASYIYDAAGNKLRSMGSDGARDYIGGIVYQDGTIEFIQTEEGRAMPVGVTNTYAYTYDLSDHLGNRRVSIDKPHSGTARTIQEDEYYAFGLNRNIYNDASNNQYLYNGKEKSKLT